MRISASDWVEGGWTPEETADFSLQLKLAGADFVHISSGGVSPQQKIVLGPDYQVPFAKLVKQKTNMPTIAVGLITTPQQAEDILVRGDADMVAMARAFLYKPRWVWEAAAALNGHVQASPQYWRCMPREAQTIFDSVQMGQR
jgi:2,4-dienoyl-CoA reductase-like NADH-dependent reductase (Old Yellow Enzyme family)